MKAKRIILLGALLVFLAMGIAWLLRTQRLNQRVEITPQTTFHLTKYILHNLDLPFQRNDDVLFLESVIRPCGNCSAEFPIEPRDQDIPFISKLSTLANRKNPPAKGFNRIMDTVQIFRFFNTTTKISSERIYAHVKAEQSIKNGRIYVYQNYLYADTFKQIFKELGVDKKGAWYRIE
ncbi:MAG TPA: hypothetical protein VF476_08820 [Chitinophagaceae bacterium]